MNDISAIECSTMSDDMSSETKLKNHNSKRKSKRKSKVLIDPHSRLVQAWFITAVLSMPIVSGCSPTVKVQSPDKPIEINMNVNIQHEIRIKVEKDIEDMVENNPDLY